MLRLGAAVLLALLGVALGGGAWGEVVLSPTSWEKWSWADGALVSGALADVQTDDDISMVFASNTSGHQMSAVYWFDSASTPDQISSITFECQFKASRTDTPSYLLLAKDRDGSGWTQVGGSLWTTTDQDFSWQTTDPASFMTDDGLLGLEICGCPGSNPNDYTTSIDLVRVRLELHTTPPAAPSGLAATVLSRTQVRLSWTDNSINEYKHKLQRKTGAAGAWSEIAQPARDATSYYDSTVAPSTTYYYRLCAYNALGDSAWTSEAEAVVPAPGPPAAPSGLSVVSRSATQLDLCWYDNARDEDDFVVEYREGSSGSFTQLAVVERDYTRYWHTGLTPGQEYQYRVCARNSLGNSDYSGVVAKTPQDRTVVQVSNLAELRDAIDAAAPGTTIEIADGDYLLDTNGIFLNDKSDLVMRSHSRNRAAVVIHGNGLNGYPEFCFKLYRSHHIVFEDMTLRDVYWHCVQVNEGSSDITFRNLYMWDAGEGPIKSTLVVDGDGYATEPYCDNGLVEDCVIGYTNGSTRGAIEGIDLMGSANWVVRRTSFYRAYGDPYYTNSVGWGFFAKGGSLDTTVDDCYFEDCGIAISFGGGGSPDDWKRGHVPQEHTGGIMRNNVVRHTTASIPVRDVAVYMNKATDFRIYNNTFWTTSDTGSSIDSRFLESTGWVYNNLCTQPLHPRDGGTATESNNLWDATAALFVDQPNNNFHLRADAAAAIDQGLDTTDWVAADMDGQARPVGLAVDIGADEYRASLFSDVPSWHWAASYIEACYTAGIVGGYDDGTYRPALTVTRDQMAVFISRALAGGDGNVPTGPATATFSDVPTEHWALKYVEYAVDNGVVGGYDDGTYRPSLTVTRDAMAVFIARAMVGGEEYVPTGPETASFPDVPTDHWAVKYVEYIRGEEVTGGYPDGTYRPLVAVTRDQMAVYVQRAFDLPI